MARSINRTVSGSEPAAVDSETTEIRPRRYLLSQPIWAATHASRSTSPTTASSIGSPP